VRWKEGTRTKANAADTYRFFESVREKNNGELDLDYAVDASRDKKSPLHNEIEWDDKKAGHEYRKEQIKYFVRTIEIIYDNAPLPVRAYESIKVERVPANDDENKSRTRNVYLSTEEILGSEDGRSQLLGQAIRDALAFKRRYAALSELSKIISVIDAEIDKIAKAEMAK